MLFAELGPTARRTPDKDWSRRATLRRRSKVAGKFVCSNPRWIFDAQFHSSRYYFFFPSLLCRCPRGQGDSGVGVAGLRSATVSWHSNVAEVCQGQDRVVERESKRPMPELHAVSREWANRGGNQQGGRKGFLMLFERAEEKSDARWCAVRRLLTIRGVWQGNWEMGERTRKRQAKTRKGPGKTAGGRYLGPASQPGRGT